MTMPKTFFLAGCALILYTIMNLIIRRYGCRICPRRSTEPPIRGRSSEQPLRMENGKENLRLESYLIQLKGIAESLELHDSVAHFQAVPQQDNDDQKFYKLALDCMVGIISKPHSFELPVEHMTNRDGHHETKLSEIQENNIMFKTAYKNLLIKCSNHKCNVSNWCFSPLPMTQIRNTH